MQIIALVISSMLARMRGERGQDLIEYGLLAGLIALAIIGVSVIAFSGTLDNMVTGIGYCIDFNNTTSCAPF